MASKFLSMPSEIRREIYEQLFASCRVPIAHCPIADEKLLIMDDMEPISPYDAPEDCKLVTYWKAEERPPCFAAILRTCRQIYHETRGLLHATILFEYKVRDFSQLFSSKFSTTTFAEQNLSKIQRLEIALHPLCPYSRNVIMETVLGLLNKIDSLKQLTLRVPTLDRGVYDDVHDQWLLTSIYDLSLSQYLGTLENLQDVWINADDDDTIGDYLRESLVPFMRTITEAKGWICDEERWPPDLPLDEESQDDDEESQDDDESVVEEDSSSRQSFPVNQDGGENELGVEASAARGVGFQDEEVEENYDWLWHLRSDRGTPLPGSRRLEL